jgi:hypothetical protein
MGAFWSTSKLKNALGSCIEHKTHNWYPKHSTNEHAFCNPPQNCKFEKAIKKKKGKTLIEECFLEQPWA